MHDAIVIDPNICHGKPVLRGTRMPVSLIVGSLAGGMGFEEVEREYSLTRAQIRAAIKFAGELVDQEEHHALGALRNDAMATQVNQTLQAFVSKPELLARLTGRLAVIESWRVRFRPHEPST